MEVKRRDSNIELLRIIIMFMILLLHANFLAFDRPEGYSFTSFSRCFAEAFTLTPVNIFVLITGFYGTHFSIRKSMNLIFQVLFCVIPISLLLIGCGVIDFKYQYFAFHRYWFINAYIGLFALTPILNAAVERFTNKEFKTVLIVFYVIAFADYLFGIEGIEIRRGASVLWFMFLYLLGRYVKANQPSCSKKVLILIILVSCLCNAFVLAEQQTDYVNPFILIQSVSTLLLFNQFKISSNFINKVAISTTMVYLVNLHPALWDLEQQWLLSLYQKFSVPLFLLYTVLSCVAIFVFAIVYDKLRLFVWNILTRKAH